MVTETIIDVSGLEAPAPFEQVVEKLSRLHQGEYIRMLHRKKPLPLLQMLEENGYAYDLRCGKDVAWEILIWNKNDDATRTYIKSVITPE